MAVKVKIGEIYKYNYDFLSEVYTWDFDRINNYWLGAYQHPQNSLILILDIFNVRNIEVPMLKVLIDGNIRYLDYAPEVILEKI